MLREPYIGNIGAVSFAPNVRFTINSLLGIHTYADTPQSINGKQVYEPIVLLRGTNYLIGALPALNMIYLADSKSYDLSLAERQPFTDTISDDTYILTLCSRYASNNQNRTCRISYIVGEGFRNAR
jgi:hypothetical protein